MTVLERDLPNSAMLLPYSANLRLARLLLAPWRLPLYIYLLWSLRPPSFLLLSLVSLQDSNPQASVQRYLCEPSHYGANSSSLGPLFSSLIRIRLAS